MIDIFDLMKKDKVIHINIEGRMYRNNLAYTIDQLIDFARILESNKDEMDIIKFEIERTMDDDIFEPLRYGLYTPRDYNAIVATFNINIYVTEDLYNMIEDYHDMITYYTKGAIRTGININSFDIPIFETIGYSLLDEDDSIYDYQIGSHRADADGDILSQFDSIDRPTRIMRRRLN